MFFIYIFNIFSYKDGDIGEFSNLHSLFGTPPFFLKEGLILITSPGGGESEKFFKGGGRMVQGQIFLKGEG